MTGNAPVYCFTIPSLHDSTVLDCRIYHPASLQDAQIGQQRTRKAALIAHPYAPLGGYMDDPVVMTIVDQLIDLDFVVGTFNFRGAADSQGSTSWAGKAERDDYVSVAGHLLFYLDYLHKSDHGPAITRDSQSSAGSIYNASSDHIALVLGGYSYGSLVVTHLPPTTEILATFHQTQSSTRVSEILLRAKELALQTDELITKQMETRGRLSNKPPRRGHQRQSSSQHSIIYGGSDSPSPADRHSIDLVHKSMEVPARIKHAIRRNRKHSTTSTPTSSLTSSDGSISQGNEVMLESLPHVLTHYLLISPLLPPISTALSFSASSLMFWRHTASHTDNLVRNPTLLIYGTEDMFTSSHKMDTWCKKMDALSAQAVGSSGQSSVRWKKVQGAGHFWREHGVEAQLTESLRKWVHEEIALDYS
ncbi:hypothetical protein D6D25_01509 [Aureobasidium pullulans]|nr:hypothetical protein D6D25_01509 [Aureobasidium pullulans]